MSFVLPRPIARLRTALEAQAPRVATDQRREDERNLGWLQRRKDAMRELLVERSPTRHGGNGDNHA
jgi:hypothetical protein